MYACFLTPVMCRTSKWKSQGNKNPQARSVPPGKASGLGTGEGLGGCNANANHISGMKTHFYTVSMLMKHFDL